MKISNFSDVFIRPILNEKSLLMREKFQFFFEVSLFADKFLVMNSVFEVFGVRPISCNIKVIKKNRKSGMGRKPRSISKKNSFSRKKIAMITFSPGSEISELNL